MDTYTEEDEKEIANLLEGRRIVSAEMGDFRFKTSYYFKFYTGKIVLDNGVELYLAGNEGGCSCSAGDYFLEKIATVDNIITSARVEALPAGDYDDIDGVYRIFVIADNQEINVAEFVGSDGNGYYGTGFELLVVHPGEKVDA